MLVCVKAMGVRQLVVVFNCIKEIAIDEMDQAKKVGQYYDTMKKKVSDYLLLLGYNMKQVEFCAVDAYYGNNLMTQEKKSDDIYD